MKIELTDDELEIGRKAVEDALVEMRDMGLSVPLRNNGLVIRHRDGTDSHIIRMGPEAALRIAIDAINHVRDKQTAGEDES